MIFLLQLKDKPTKILTDFVFDKAKYSDYSEIYLSSTFALAYGMSFASLCVNIRECLLRNVMSFNNNAIHKQHLYSRPHFPLLPEKYLEPGSPLPQR